MEIIKKIKIGNTDKAWVSVDDTNAVLIPYTKDDAKAKDDAKTKSDSDKAKRDRLAVVRFEIKRIKAKYNIA